MADVTPPNTAFYWATLLIRELYNCGVDRAVISPGSRSTPLTLAAATHPGINSTVIVDERSAGFQALGYGKATGKPAALICTSGTAAANYYPAVIESRKYGVPLLLLTADRPPNRRDIGANQAIDQLKLYGNYPVFFHEAGEPSLEKNDIHRLRTAADQAFNYAIIQRGPAQINLPFRKPLEPTGSFLNQQNRENKKSSISSRPKTEVNHEQTAALNERFLADLRNSRQPVLICGPEDPPYFTPERISRWAKLLNAPILAEPGSNIPHTERNIRGYAGFLRSESLQKKLTPDLMLRFGKQPCTKAIDRYLEMHSQAAHHLFTTLSTWHDATYSTDVIHFGQIPEPDDLNPESYQAPGNWLERWKKAEKESQDVLVTSLKGTDVLTDGAVFNHITKNLPGGSSVFLSNSFPVRDMALFGDNNDNTTNTFVNRGASGIDGITSTFIGISRQTVGPGILFIGDLAFYHDLNALAEAAKIESPLLIVILNNGGGTIFRMLPISEHKKYFSDYFETPQSIDIQSLSRGYGLAYKKMGDPEQLNQLDPGKLLKENGVTILDCHTDAKISMWLREQLWNAGDNLTL